jgi:hypothetical protein
MNDQTMFKVLFGFIEFLKIVRPPNNPIFPVYKM